MKNPPPHKHTHTHKNGNTHTNANTHKKKHIRNGTESGGWEPGTSMRISGLTPHTWGRGGTGPRCSATHTGGGRLHKGTGGYVHRCQPCSHALHYPTLALLCHIRDSTDGSQWEVPLGASPSCPQLAHHQPVGVLGWHPASGTLHGKGPGAPIPGGASAPGVVG